MKYGGALSGEHGDGLVRSPFQEKMFGPVLYQAFREIKRTFIDESGFEEIDYETVRARKKMQAQGRGLLVNHSLPAPAHWWQEQTWKRLGRLLPEWILPHLEIYRPILLALDAQIASLSTQLEAAAPRDLPRGLGALTSVVLSREVCE